MAKKLIGSIKYYEGFVNLLCYVTYNLFADALRYFLLKIFLLYMIYIAIDYLIVIITIDHKLSVVRDMNARISLQVKNVNVHSSNI